MFHYIKFYLEDKHYNNLKIFQNKMIQVIRNKVLYKHHFTTKLRGGYEIINMSSFGRYIGCGLVGEDFRQFMYKEECHEV